MKKAERNNSPIHTNNTYTIIFFLNNATVHFHSITFLMSKNMPEKTTDTFNNNLHRLEHSVPCKCIFHLNLQFLQRALAVEHLHEFQELGMLPRPYYPLPGTFGLYALIT